MSEIFWKIKVHLIQQMWHSVLRRYVAEPLLFLAGMLELASFSTVALVMIIYWTSLSLFFFQFLEKLKSSKCGVTKYKNECSGSDLVTISVRNKMKRCNSFWSGPWLAARNLPIHLVINLTNSVIPELIWIYLWTSYNVEL